jgi:hypothetical protein
MRFRKLRITLSVVCGITCALLIVLWVRSYAVIDNFVYRLDIRGVAFGSYGGDLHFGTLPSWRGLPWDVEDGRLRIRHWRIYERTTNPMEQVRQGYMTPLGFGMIDNSSEFAVFVPYWFLCGISGVCAAVLWPMKSRQYRLRTLLIATTLVAVVLGLASWLASK